MTQDEILSKVSTFANLSRKNAWNRQHRNLNALLETLEPLETEIIGLQAQKMNIMDEMAELRQRMLEICIHPLEFLVIDNDNLVTCKFCNKRMRVSDGNQESS